MQQPDGALPKPGALRAQLKSFRTYPFGEALVIDTGGGGPLLLLNASSRLIWDGITSGHETEAMIRRFVAQYGISPTEAENYIHSAIDLWHRGGLLDAPHPEYADDGTSAVFANNPATTGTDTGAAPGNTVTRVFDLCGRPIAIEFGSADISGILGPRFEYSETASTPERSIQALPDQDGFRISGGTAPVTVENEEDLLGQLLRCFIEQSYGISDWLAVLHAAAVKTPQGRNLVLPGTNGRGKSTLVAGLQHAGYSYFSDDCVPITPRGLIGPVPFAICVKEGSWDIVRQFAENFDTAPVIPNYLDIPCRYIVPERICRDLEPVDAIVFPQYSEDATRTCRRLDPAEALERLLLSRAWISRNPESLAKFLAIILSTPAFELHYSHFDDAKAELDRLDLPPVTASSE